MAKEAHELFVNSVGVVGACMSILIAMLRYALYYCGFFKSLWNLDSKQRNAAIGGVCCGMNSTCQM